LTSLSWTCSTAIFCDRAGVATQGLQVAAPDGKVQRGGKSHAAHQSEAVLLEAPIGDPDGPHDFFP
jgi:hypothetical protein